MNFSNLMIQWVIMILIMIWLNNSGFSRKSHDMIWLIMMVDSVNHDDMIWLMMVHRDG